MEFLLLGLALVLTPVVAVFLLKGFDVIAGRGPKQVSRGIREANEETADRRPRQPCPHCAEMILPQAKVCPFCKSSLTEL